MSVNTPNTPGTFISQPILEVDALSGNNTSSQIRAESPHLASVESLMSRGVENIPISTINSEIMNLKMALEKIINEISMFLNIGYVKADLSPTMEQAHYQVCQEALKLVSEENQVVEQFTGREPDYVSYSEYSFAQNHQSRACRSLIVEYESFVGRSAVGYNYDVKNILDLIMMEIMEINNFMQSTIGGEYDDEVEQKLCKEIYYWIKSYAEYTKQLARETLSLSEEIPQSEMDSVSQVQAAQFKAFFSIKVNSYNSEIKKVHGMLKRELADTCAMYYRNFLAPAVKSRSLVAYPLELSLLSTNMKNSAPILAKEVVSAASNVNGNLASLLADFKQRKMNAENRIVALLLLIREKRKYVSYVKQMEEKCGVKDDDVFVDVEDPYFDGVFDNVVQDTEKRETLNSSHKYFNDLNEDHHPQYMLKTGGVFLGDIQLGEGVKVAGLDLANHSHSGTDGSSSIRASSIDYFQDRENSSAFFLDGTENEATLSVDSYSPKIQIAGQPLVDASVTVSLQGDNLEQGRYSVNVTYVEIPD